ncbi:MAG: Do family serine endopeptidase [Nevskia sp.]|nr:Do family serine endopeptidase [Nevskia sp.]
MQITKTTMALAAAGLFAAGAAGGLGATALLGSNALASQAAATVAAPAAPSGPITLGTAPNYRAIVAQNSGAVVGITADGTTPVADHQDPQEGPGGPGGPGGQGEDPQDNPFSHFFRGLPMPPPQGRAPTRGLGSGFIVTADGLILTNAHVVHNAQRVSVKLQDHREFKARVLGVDPVTDIAVLKIDAHDLPVVRPGNSASLAVGDYVLAIGAPYGFEESATAGIVSAKGRSLPGDSYVPFIQTDVAVNPGNSGGPLFDSSGAVVGINSQIYSNTGGYEGLSFAIPIDVALHIKDQIVAHGKVEHARLGITIQPIDQALAKSFKLELPAGALVSKVNPDSAAARAGIKPGDVILKYDGEPLTDSGQLSARVGMAQPGDTVKLDIWRDGKPMKIEAKLGTYDQVASADEPSAGEPHGKLGLAVRPLSPDEKQASGISGGLLVEQSTGPAEQAGIQPGDVVIAVDGKPVNSADDISRIIGKQDGTVALLIQRGESRIFVPVDLG